MQIQSSLARAGRSRTHLRILATTDLHLHLMPYDYLAGKPTDRAGLASAAGLIRQLQSDAENSLLFDNGDFLQGTPLSDWLADMMAQDGAGPHPMIAAMNVLGYDAATLGNHEFDYGVPALRRALQAARFPIVSANIMTSAKVRGIVQADQACPFVAPFTLLHRRVTDRRGRVLSLTIGVIGFAPPQTATWDRYHLKDKIETLDIVEAARAMVPRIKAAGADIVIALSHSGIGSDTHEAGMENATVPLAAIPGIDALFAGHTHEVFPGTGVAASDAVDPVSGTLHGKPAVMAGFHGSHLGVIDLLLEYDDGKWSMIGHQARAIPVDGSAKVRNRADRNDALGSILIETHGRALGQTRRVIGITSVPLHSYFGLIEPNAAQSLLADAKRDQAKRRLADTEWSGLPIVVAVSCTRTGGHGGPDNYLDVAPGPVEQRHIAAICAYPNALTALLANGATVMDWLERAVCGYAQITAGQVDQPLLDPAFPGYCFDQLDGLTYQIDPRQPARMDAQGQIRDPAARRIQSLRLNGAPLLPEDRLVIVTNSFRAAGGGGFPMAPTTKVLFEGPETTLDILLRWVTRSSPLSPVPRPSWYFAPMPGTSAWFDSGPRAAEHLGSAGQRDISVVGPQPSGFTRFNLAL